MYVGYTVYTHGLLPTIIIRDLSPRGAGHAPNPVPICHS